MQRVSQCPQWSVHREQVNQRVLARVCVVLRAWASSQVSEVSHFHAVVDTMQPTTDNAMKCRTGRQIEVLLLLLLTGQWLLRTSYLRSICRDLAPAFRSPCQFSPVFAGRNRLLDCCCRIRSIHACHCCVIKVVELAGVVRRRIEKAVTAA